MRGNTPRRTTQRVCQSRSVVFACDYPLIHFSDRFCIKIPTTSAGVQAAAVLYREGIRTLGTSLFSLPQAIAAAQANMLSISPYFNEVRAHVEYGLWPDVEDPATQHPMAARMIYIRDTYAKMKAEGKTVPLNKAASWVTPVLLDW